MPEQRLPCGQFRSLIPTFLVIYLPTLLLLLSLWILYRKTGFDTWFLTADPLEACLAPFYLGAVSNLGILLWCASAAVCLFGFALLNSAPGRRRAARFLLFSGLLISLLTLDDLYQLHEKIYRDTLNIPETAVNVTYGLLLLAVLAVFRKVIAETDYLLLILALGFFGISLGFDLRSSRDIEGELFEDGAKLLGLVSWTAYFIRAALRISRAALHPGSGPEKE